MPHSFPTRPSLPALKRARVVADTVRPARAFWGVAASIALHVLLLLAALLIRPQPFAQEEERAIAVRIVTPSQLAAEAAPRAPPVLSVNPAEQARVPPVAPPAKTSSGMVRPGTMLSARNLAHPRSKKARADLATFAIEERGVQLCNIEAMEQIAAWNKDLRPDSLVAYARANEKVAGSRIVAAGAAFHSGRKWYELAFNCDLSPAMDKVVAFEFKVGKPVPPTQWEDLGLSEGDADDD